MYANKEEMTRKERKKLTRFNTQTYSGGYVRLAGPEPHDALRLLEDVVQEVDLLAIIHDWVSIGLTSMYEHLCRSCRIVQCW